MESHTMEHRLKDADVICTWGLLYDSCQLNKSTSVFHATVLLLITDFVIALTMLWRNLLSIRGQAREKLRRQFAFYHNKLSNYPLSHFCSLRQDRICYRFRRLSPSWQITIRPVARKGYGPIAHEAKPNGLFTRGPWERRV